MHRTDVEHFVLESLRTLGLNPSLTWDPEGRVATFFITLERPVTEALYTSTRKGASMYHNVQRKEKGHAQKERYVPAMNNGWWKDWASSIAFVVYSHEGETQFKLADGYQRTASAYKAHPPHPLKFVGVVHLCESERESGDIIRHYNLGQQKTPDDHIRGADAFTYVSPTFLKTTKVIATRIRYWNANAFGQILPDEWQRMSEELELPLKAFERILYFVRSGHEYDFERAALDADLDAKDMNTVYARLVGILYQARDPQKALKFCDAVIRNEIPEVEPRLLKGESTNMVTKMIMDAYCSFCDPRFQPVEVTRRKDWPWEPHVPHVATWPVFAHSKREEALAV